MSDELSQDEINALLNDDEEENVGEEAETESQETEAASQDQADTEVEDGDLSQGEIDALLDDDEGGDEASETETQEAELKVSDVLSGVEEDALGEVANISMGSATTALYGLLDKKVDITTPRVNISTLQQLVDSYSKPCVVVDVQYVEGLKGSNQLILEIEDAAVITDLMMGGDGENPPAELDSMHLSAVAEAMNQMMGSASTSMSDFFAGDRIDISPPSAELLEVNTETLGLEGIDADDEIVMVDFDIVIGDGLVDSKMIQVMTVDFAKQMAEGLMQQPAPEPDETDSSGSKADAQAQQVQDQNSPQHQAEQQVQQQQQTAAAQPQQQTQQPRQPQQQPQQPRQQPQQQRPVAQQQRRSQQPAAGPQQPQGDVEVQDVELNQLGGAQDGAPQNDLSLIYDVDLELTVRLGKTQMSIKEILELGSGSVIELDRLAGEAVDLLVNGKLIAKGEVVVIDENFGFRVTDIVSSQQRLQKL